MCAKCETESSKPFQDDHQLTSKWNSRDDWTRMHRCSKAMIPTQYHGMPSGGAHCSVWCVGNDAGGLIRHQKSREGRSEGREGQSEGKPVLK